MPGPDLFLEPVLRDLNPWWDTPPQVRPQPPKVRRRHVTEMAQAIARRTKLIHVIRGPRQVGKTTALYQIVEELLASGTLPTDICLARFDLQQLREQGLLTIVRWHREQIRKSRGTGAILLLDEVHKLERWDEQVKHVHDTHAPTMVLTGSSSVLVARGQRESLAGRSTTLDFPPFLFREVLEAWHPKGLEDLPPAIDAGALFQSSMRPAEHFAAIHSQRPQRALSWRRRLDRYYNRGGYPRLHSGDVEDDQWADYLTETVFERVLGVDIPDLFHVEQPQLLRHIYLEIARQTGCEVKQTTLAEACNSAGFKTTQPVVGRYLHYLSDALLIREFRRYPIGKRTTSRVPVKITLTDLGVRNAIFRGAPSLWESPPDVVGPLVETLVQTVLRARSVQVHFYRDYSKPGDRRSPVEEVDFVLEALGGQTIPVEVKFRHRIDAEDLRGVRSFLRRYGSPFGIIVTRDSFQWLEKESVLLVPLQTFLLAF